MKHYKVESVFRDKAGRELSRKLVWSGEEQDARCALAEAHKAMAAVCAKDPRIDMVATTVKGLDGETITTTDYADELGSGYSSSGLMEEINPEDLDRSSRESIEQQAMDVLANDAPADGWDNPSADPLGDMQRVVRELEASGGAYAPGGAEPDSADTFRAADDVSDDGGGARGVGNDAATSPAGSPRVASPSDAREVPHRRGHFPPVEGELRGEDHTNPTDAATPGTFAPRTDRRFHGPDLLGHLRDAVTHNGDRAVQSIRVSPQVMERLRRDLNVDSSWPDPHRVLGVPITVNPDPVAPPIQIVRQPRFHTGGAVTFPHRALAGDVYLNGQYAGKGHLRYNLTTTPTTRGETTFKRLYLGEWE